MASKLEIKPYFKVVFIVLVYRNTSDLEEFFKNLKVPYSKVIVVNSYFDEESREIFENIAKNHKADFLNVSNNGYGAGNNKGIDFALNNYNFELLIISNADITIQNFDINNINKNVVTAPKILTKSGKNQNPSTPFFPSRLRLYLQYLTYKYNHCYLIWSFYALSRLSKIIYYSISPLRSSIFAPHGAFIIIPQKILKICVPIFNEKMFLFNEEVHLGLLLKKNKFKVNYNKKIVINHKEDGSVSLLNMKLFTLERNSFLELYEHWYK